jgi:Glutathione peroxidase
MSSSLYDIEVERLSGGTTTLGEYAGKVLLIVNTASQCGLTPHYAGLEKLHQTYKDRGLAVLGFPCNQFGAEEPGSAEEIGAFCTKNYGVSFPMFAKIEVNGDGAHPLYKYLSSTPKASSAPRRSSGTSPSSWSAETASASNATHRRPRRRTW